MSKTRVIHVNDMLNYPDAVYVGRAMPRRGLKPSEWQNPYKIGRDGDRAEVIEKYRQMLAYWLAPITPDSQQIWMNGLRKLVGKPLACWCRRDGEERTADNACHGDEIIRLLRELGLEGDEQEDAT